MKMRYTKLSLLAITCLTGLFLTGQASRPVAEKNGPAAHQGFLDGHNTARAEVGVAPIIWNDTVAAYAQNYANKRIGDCEMEHSGGPYGECLASGSWKMSDAEAVQLWVDEKLHYDYATNKCVGGECGHYTQVVWRNSIHLGCASVKCRSGWTYVVCSYDSPGNYVGERPY